MPISRAGVETQVYLPTGGGRLRVQNDIKERNAKRRGSLDEAQKTRRGNTYVYTSAPATPPRPFVARRLSLCPDVALVRIPRTVSQAMPAMSLPVLHCDNGRSHHRHNARTGWSDGSAASRCRTCKCRRRFDKDRAYHPPCGVPLSLARLPSSICTGACSQRSMYKSTHGQSVCLRTPRINSLETI